MTDHFVLSHPSDFDCDSGFDCGDGFDYDYDSVHGWDAEKMVKSGLVQR